MGNLLFRRMRLLQNSNETKITLSCRHSESPQGRGILSSPPCHAEFISASDRNKEILKRVQDDQI